MATRDYGKVAPQFWTGETGRALRAHGRDAQLLALYLVTNRHATMIGLYYLPLTFIAHETGFTLDEVEAALGALQAAGYCRYDEERELVWVCEMARFQVDEQLRAGDKRVPHIRSMLAEYHSSPLRRAFEGRYAKAFHLQEGPSEGHRRGIGGASSGDDHADDAPPKPESRNREQEQRTDDDRAQPRDPESSSSVSAPAPVDLHGWRIAAMELLELWRTAGPPSPCPASVEQLTAESRRKLRDALAAKSLAAWEAIFTRAARSDYLAGRGEYPPITLWKALAWADRIEAGEFDARVRAEAVAPADGRPLPPLWTTEDDARLLEEQRVAAEIVAARKARGELPLSEQIRQKREAREAAQA